MSDNIKVFVKVRPLIPREIEDKLTFQWRVKNNTLYQLDPKDGRDFGQAFTFDKVYDQDTKTSDVYNDVAKPIVEAATAGFNGTIFAYGQTSSGKTYTMTGTEESPGIIPLAVLNLFEIIKNIPDRDFLVRVSYIEIYNETLKDLLNLEKENIKIHETLQGIKVDVTEKVTSSPEEVLDIMKKGEANRQTGSTNMNEASSRSHSIFQIIIESREHVEGEEQAGCVNVSQLNLVDLAGSERAGQTGATGLRFKEGTHINKSLSALALVIKQLSEGPNKYANYRDSKLTRILQNSLGGNAKTSIICAVTLATVEETVSTLQFANRAKAIKNKPEVNAVATDATMIQGLTKELSKLQSQLESKKSVEQDNHNLQKQIAALQRLILNGFAQRRSIDFMDGARRKLQQQRRVTISTLHSIEDDPPPNIVKFRTPVLKYNPMAIPNPSDFVPIQSSGKLETLPEEPTTRLITPPPTERRVNFTDEIIELDSDDDDNMANPPTCSPYHKCYDSSKTPPCILRKNAKQAEKNFQDIVELTEREKMYSPSVIELIKKNENYTNVITSLKEDLDNLSKQSKEKDFEMDQLKNKIKKTEEEVKSINTVKMELETQCSNFNTKLTDWEVSYETLKKKAKLREEELLSMLDEKNNKYRNPENICKTLSRTLDKELTQFMDMSKDISLVNSDNDSSITNPGEEPSALIQDIVSDLQTQLTLKNQSLLELETNLFAHKQKISSLENSAQELQEMVSTFQKKLEFVESENSLLKSTVDNLNSTIHSQRVNLETANSDIESYNNVIQELQIQLTTKDNNLNLNVNDNILESMIANEENIIANNENIRNIIYSFKNALDARSKEIDQLKKSTIPNDTESATDTSNFNEHIEAKTKQVNLLNEEVQILKQQLSDNITTIDKLLIDKKYLEDVKHDLTTKLVDLENKNKENSIAIDILKETHNKLLLNIEDKDLKEQKILSLNEDLMKTVEELNIKIINLEKEITHKENEIESLKQDDEITQNNLEKAKSSIIRVKEILAMLTDEIQDVPAVIDNFVFSTLNDSLSTLETTVIRAIAEKDEAVKINVELKNELTSTINKHNTESSSLLLQIDNLTETANRFNDQNEILSKQLKELTSQLDQIRCEHSEKIDDLVSLKNKANMDHEDLSSKENLIALLRNNESTLCSKIETLQQNSDQKCKHFQNEIENLSISIKSNEDAFNEALRAKDKVIADLKLSFNDIETELKEKHRDLEIKFQKNIESSRGTDKLMTNILEKVTQITGDFHIENNLSCDFENRNVNIYEQILLTLDKIVNHIKLIDSGCSDSETNLENILLDAKEEIRELTQQNLKLMSLLSEIQDKNHVMSLEIEKIQHENRGLKENLLESHSLLEQLKIELKNKVQEIDIIEMKTKDWKEQFISLDLMMKQQIEEMQLENDELKTKYLKLKMTQHCNEPTDDPFSELEYYQDEITKKSHSNVVKPVESLSPPSLLTICCNKIIDAIQPSETDTKSVTPSSSNINVEKQSVESQVNICQCNNLSIELRTIKDENIRLLKIMAELEYVNQELLREQDEVRKELQLLLAPVNELHKKLTNHKTNLSILTATSYAENKSLKSQVKVLQHHHSRYHNVCQRDIPAFKNQLLELMTILKREQTLTNVDNLKRYSLPDVLDNNTTISNFKNESTLDGDLLMLDTNVTVTTSDDTTLMGHELTCLDLTLYNEACCQNNDLNQTTNLNSVCSQVQILNSNYHNMLESLSALKEENEKLRLLIDKNSLTEPKIDAMCSPVKLNNCFTENSLNPKLNNKNTCENCSNVDELRLKYDNLSKELNTLSEELIDVRAQKADIEGKYKNLSLEMPSTDALVSKLNVLEKDYNVKLQENIRLTTMLHNKTTELKQLQEENDTLSTQVMENISEIDDLNKELDRVKEVNVELAKESRIENKTNVSISCSQCTIKDDLINSLQTKNEPETHTKLNRSFSDSETSSRHNKICTLQNELDAGRADCKELTEEVTTIKNHLERSNLSMDLDDSMGDPNIFGFKSFDAANSQYNKCNMPGIPEDLPLDAYMVDKLDCINYYIEKTDAEKESLNYNIKIIDVLKMLHNNLLTKHANEVENLVNRLRDFEESKNLLQLQINDMTSKYSKSKDELEIKDEYFSKFANVLALIKNNTNIINSELLNITDTDKTKTLATTFKENLLKILDNEFGLSCSHVFDSLIDSIVNKHQNDLIEITDRYTKLQTHVESVTTELNSANANVTQMKCQLSDRENEYNLLKSQKERVQEISKAVTLDIIKKEQDLSDAITTGCQKLLELNIINPGDIDLSSPLNKNINLLFEHLISQHKNTSNPEKELLAIEVKNSKSIIDEKQKQLDEMKVRNEKMQEINNNVTLDLIDKEKQLQTFKTLHEDMSKIYESKIQENTSNLSLIETLTQEIVILKECLAQKEEIVKSLESKLEAQKNERTSEKDEKLVELLNKVKTLQENLENLKAANEMIIKEKEICASELEKSSETIKHNKMDLEKMTSDILILRESVKENTSVIEKLQFEAKSLLKQNSELKQQIEIKCKDCSRLETNIKTHEKTAEIQSKMIMRLQKQKEQDDKSKNIHLEELTEKWMQLQNECDELQNRVKVLNNDNEGLKLSKQSLEARVAELEVELQSGYKPRTSIDAIADTSRMRRQSLHDSKRLFGENKHEIEDNNNMDAVFESRSKPDDLFMDVDDNASDRSTPNRMSRGRDSLLSRTDQSDKDDEHPSRPSSVQATRRRRQSTHDLHRSVLRHTPSPHDSCLLEELKSEAGNYSNNSELSQVKQLLTSCQQELEDLKEKYRELDDECETCAEYLRERDEQCKRLRKDKVTLENTIKELKEKLELSNSNISQVGDKIRSVAHVSVNTDEDWANLHSVVVDRMSFDAEVEKNKRLVKTIEELRFKNQELKNTMAKMQKALEKNSGRHNNRELEATKLELQSCKEELEDLRQRYKELDEECETCAEYLRERDEQCRRLREAKLALEAKLEQLQEDDSVGNILQSVRKKRQSTHDQNRTLAVDVTDATTETSDDFLSYQVERDNSSQLLAPDAKSKEIKRLKMAVDKLSQQKAALENQMVAMSSAPAPKPMFVATGSAIVQSQQLTDVMKENQKLKKINAKLINLCKKRDKDTNRENVDPSEQG